MSDAKVINRIRAVCGESEMTVCLHLRTATCLGLPGRGLAAEGTFLSWDPSRCCLAPCSVRRASGLISS